MLGERSGLGSCFGRSTEARWACVAMGCVALGSGLGDLTERDSQNDGAPANVNTPFLHTLQTPTGERVLTIM
jgi:hypothetical protein